MKKLLYLILCTPIFLFSQTPGSIDPTFNSTDAGYDVISGIGYNWHTSGSASNGQVFCSSIQSDGKTIIGGNFIVYNGISTNKIARLNTDGSLDTTFNIGTGFNSPQNLGLSAIYIQSNGKILVAGSFTNYNGVDVNGLVRLNTDGSLDTTFNAGTGPNNSIKSIVAQLDGKIYVCGDFTLFNNTAANYIVRLFADGSVDSLFDSANSQPNAVGINTMDIQSDGKVIIGGNFTLYFGVVINRIARLNPDGTLDLSFNIGSGANAVINSIIICPGGKILVGGSFTTFNGVTNNYLVRLQNSGIIDTSFNSGTNTSLNSSVTQIKLVSNIATSKIMIIGNFSTFNGVARNKIARLNQFGGLDTTFDLEPVLIPTLYDPNFSLITTFRSISIQNDGKIILCGQFQTTYYNGASVNRLDTSGYFDFTFNTKKLTGANGTIRAIATQTDGKILLGGDFTEYNGYHSPGIVRINPNGEVDYTFQSQFKYINPNYITQIFDIAIQTDGQIIVVGRLYETELALATKIKRIDSNGSYDLNFIPPTINGTYIYSVEIQTDGKIVLGFQSTPGLKRLNQDGSNDTTFTIGTGTANVFDIKLLPNGKMYVSGSFSSYNGISSGSIIRINSNGVYDTSFTGSGGGKINVMAFQPDGKIIIGGTFIGYSSNVSTRCLARINDDGSIDQTFFPITTNIANNLKNISTICIQPDSKIIIGGEFTNINGVTCNNIARLNSDGTLDSTFQIGQGANDVVNASIVQSDGKILIGGNFNAYNSTGRNRAARLNGGNALAVSEIIGLNKIILFPNPAHESITIKLGDNLISNCSLRVNNLLGQEVYRSALQDAETQITKTWSGSGLYLVNIYDQNNQLLETHKVVFE